MTTRISSNNLDTTVTAQFGPKISSISVTDNAYATIDDTAVSVAGGYIVISGSNFVTGCTVLIGSVVATSVSFVNSTTVRAQVPAQSAGSYTVYLTNPDGGVAIRVNGLNYSATPTWVTTSPLTSGQVNAAISIQLSATSNGNVTYALQAGSSLPAGVTLSNVGLLSGTVTGITVETTYNFTVVATDTELQDTPQAFSITITANDPNFRNTTLLLSANTPSSTFVSDASTNAFNITVNGDTRPNNFGPYTPGYYSNFFDGTGDYLSFPTNNLLIGSNNFTMEAWVYLTASPSTAAGIFYGQGDGASPSGASYGFLIAAATTSDLYVGSSTYGITSPTPQLNQWVHVAWVRTGGTFSSYLNGSRVGTRSDLGTSSINAGSTSNTPKIGAVNNGSVYNTTGYISNARIIIGSGGYDATQTTITVPTAPLTAITNTSLLTCASNRLIDTSTNAFAITKNGDVRVDGFNPFVPASNTATYGSGYFDGTGDYLQTPSDAAFTFGTGDFTIEFWIYVLANISTYSKVYMSGTSSDNIAIETQSSTNTLSITNYTSTVFLTSSTALSLNTWTHVAATRSGTTMRLFQNGVQVGSVTNSTNFSGSFARIGESFNCFISNLRVLKGTALYTSAFTPPTQPLTAISGTSLLTLQTNQPANNNQFVDRSTNNFLITRNGNATPGSFSPYAGTWSNYFDGTGDYLSVPNNAAFDLTADFTLELWFNFSSLAASSYTFLSNYASGGAGWSFQFRGDASNVFRFGLGDTPIVNSSTQSLTVGTWYHLALTRSGSTIRMFLNGTQIGTTTSLSSFTSSAALLVGSLTTGAQFFPGNISNVRIVKGTALYTADFTPPTAPLLPITNTSLLTCADNRFIDDSNNNFTITRNGDVSVQKFSPFSLQTQIVPTSYSVYFDGTGDNLTTVANTAFAFAKGDLTVEMWIYPTATITSPANIGLFYIEQTDGLVVGLSNGYLALGSRAVAYSITSSYIPPVGAWTHVAVTRSGATAYIFANGTQVGTVTASGGDPNNNANYVCTTGLPTIAGNYAGGAGFGYFTGYISNVRVVKGTAVYTANFTPPTAPLTAITNTSLLTCQSTTIIDNSTNNFTITVNGNSQPLPQNPFGYTNPTQGPYTVSALGGSMYFDGTGDYLTIPYSTSAFDWWTTNYTIELWTNLASLSNANALVGNMVATSATNYWCLGINTSGQIAFYYFNGTGVTLTGTTTSTTINTWTHIAMVKSGSNILLFTNGILQSTTAVSGTPQSSNAVTLTIGGYNTTNLLTGYISNLRIVKGQALYTSAFVPPQSPLTAVQNSVLLLNGTSAGVTDSSMMNDYETVGDTRINNTIVKFSGTNSIYFDGTGDYLLARSNPVFAFGTGNYTIETWVYPTTIRNGENVIYCVDVTGGTAFGFNQTQVYVGARATGYDLQVTYTVQANTWTHLAVARQNGTARIFANGTLVGSGTISRSCPQGPAGIGDYPTLTGNGITGYLSDLRVTPGVARYTANFTAPTTPYIQY